jgi:plasmid stabilization system protein ParE
MTYRVFLQRLAREDLAGSYGYVARRAPVTAGRWLDRFQRALGTLARNPQRCPFARENGKVELELREFHFGTRPNVFRVIYTIDGPLVRILRMRRAQRRLLSRRQIKQALRTEQPANEDDEEA